MTEDDIFEGVPRNGTDRQAMRRAHMRALVAARQEIERRYAPQRHESLDDASSRREQKRTQLRAIEAAHQAWLSSVQQQARETSHPPRRGGLITDESVRQGSKPATPA